MTRSPRPRILNAEPDRYSPEAVRRLEEVAEVVLDELPPERLAEAAQECDVLIVRLAHRLDRGFFEKTPRLRAVVTATTGLDHIDLDAAADHGVTVLSLRGETAFLRTVTATAEHSWALLLALVRRLGEALPAGASGAWDRDALRGRELQEMRLGILGLGRLGEKVARFGLAFDMEVKAFDPYREGRAEGWVDGVGKAGSLDELLEHSDVLSIHVPLNEETRRMIGAGELGRLPTGARIVNTSRGGVLDGAAALAALEAGHLSGIAVDVVEGETAPGGVEADPLVQRAAQDPRVIVTPHIGGATLESMARTEIFMADKTIRFLEASFSPLPGPA